MIYSSIRLEKLHIKRILTPLSTMSALVKGVDLAAGQEGALLEDRPITFVLPLGQDPRPEDLYTG